MKTWPDIVEMRRGLALMLQGNPYFAWQYTFLDDKGVMDHKYRPCYDLRQLETFADDILAGERTVGFYTIRPDNLTRWGAIDYDDHGSIRGQHWQDSARRAFDLLAPRFDELWLLESSPGSFHVVSFLIELAPARDIRAVLKECAPPEVEVFPKKDELDASDPKAKGNLIRFPGRHQLKGTWARFIARHGRISEPDKGITPAKSLNSKWAQPSEAGRLESLYAVVTREIDIAGPGQRYRAMQRIVGRLKGRAKSEADAEWVHDTFYNRHQENIRTPFVDSRIEFLKWYRKAAPCNVELPDYVLSSTEIAVLASLPKMPNVPLDKLQETMRFFFRARRHAAETGRGLPFLSCRYIGERLGVCESSACNYISALRQLGKVKLVERGHTGKANVWEVKTNT